MELRRVAPSALDLSLSRLRQLPAATVDRMQESLRNKGQLSPLVAGCHEGRLMLVDGFVRQLAAERLGLESVLVEVVDLSPTQMKAQVYLRNRERGLRLIEECRLVRELVEVDRLSQVEVSDLLERHKSWVCRRLALSREVSPHLLENLSVGLLGEGSLRKLAQLPARNQEELWAVCQRDGLSAPDLRSLAELWQRAPEPEAVRYLLEHPREALRLARGDDCGPEDPRLGKSGREVLETMTILRRVALRLMSRVGQGLSELPPEAVAQLNRARERAETDCRAALDAVAARLRAAGGAS